MLHGARGLLAENISTLKFDAADAAQEEWFKYDDGNVTPISNMQDPGRTNLRE